MTDHENPPAPTLMQRAATLVALLLPVAALERGALPDELEKLTAAQTRAALICVAVTLERRQDDAGVRFMPEGADAVIEAAANGLEPLQATVLGLTDADARRALGELLALHVELDATDADAAASAANN